MLFLTDTYTQLLISVILHLTVTNVLVPPVYQYCPCQKHQFFNRQVCVHVRVCTRTHTHTFNPSTCEAIQRHWLKRPQKSTIFLLLNPKPIYFISIKLTHSSFPSSFLPLVPWSILYWSSLGLWNIGLCLETFFDCHTKRRLTSSEQKPRTWVISLYSALHTVHGRITQPNILRARGLDLFR